jgi:hypothetical protein
MAITAGEAADRITITLERLDDVLLQPDLSGPAANLASISDRTTRRLSWCAVGVVAFLLVGLAIIRLISIWAAEAPPR